MENKIKSVKIHTEEINKLYFKNKSIIQEVENVEKKKNKRCYYCRKHIKFIATQDNYGWIASIRTENVLLTITKINIYYVTVCEKCHTKFTNYLQENMKGKWKTK